MSRFFLILTLFSYSCSASAYLDPGTGSMILQGLIAGIAVVGITIKTYSYKLRGMFRTDHSSSLSDEENDLSDSDVPKTWFYMLYHCH
jgi:hypothetical protein